MTKNFRTMKIILSRQELLAALLFASTDESRFVLNGVCIEVGPNRAPLLIATDGKRLAAIEIHAVQEETFEAVHSFVLASDFLKLFAHLSKTCGGKVFPLLAIEVKPGSQRLIASVVGRPVFCEVEKDALIVGNYPEWRKVIPAKSLPREPLSQLGLNAEYVADFAKAAKLLECDSPQLAMSLVGKEAAVEVKLCGNPNFYGLIMPVKIDEQINFQPEFLQLTEAA